MFTPSFSRALNFQINRDIFLVIMQPIRNSLILFRVLLSPSFEVPLRRNPAHENCFSAQDSWAGFLRRNQTNGPSYLWTNDSGCCALHGSTRNGTTTLWIGSLFSKNSNLFFSVKLCQPNDVIKSLIFYLVLRKRQLTVKRQKWFALIAYELKVLLQQEVKFTNSYPSVFSIWK